MDADSTVIIKVKYGDILRRFRARVIDGEFSLTMYGLRKMIFSLFGFSPDKEIMLTYIDEDGDVATFVDFVDLRDVVKQGINPIRFTVSPIPGNDNDATKICGSSKPLNLPSENDAIKFHSNWTTEAVDNLPKAQPVITNSGISKATMGNDSSKAASSSNGCNNTIVGGKEKARESNKYYFPEAVINENIFPNVVQNSAYTSAANLGYRYPCCGTSASCWGDYCDICGMYPKTVYRFISKGICTICFKEFEKEINEMDKEIPKHVDDALNLNFPPKGSSTYYPKIKSAEAKSLHELRNSKKRAEVVRKDVVGIQ